MNDQEHSEEQKNTNTTRKIPVIVFQIAIAIGCVAGLSYLPFFNMGRYPLQGLHFLLPLSLYAYLIFFLVIGGFTIISFYGMKQKPYKTKWILFFLLTNVIIIANMVNVGSFLASFKSATTMAADRNNTLYVFDSLRGDIVRENADKDLYERKYVPNLKKFLDYTYRPCVTNNGVCIFASMEEGVFTYDFNTGHETHWLPDGLSFVCETYIDVKDDIVFVAFDSDETMCAQWHQPDGTLIKKIIFDEQLPCDADIIAFGNECFVFIDTDELVYVLDENGQQVNTWKLPGLSSDASEFYCFYDCSNMSTDGTLYFLFSERKFILKCDLSGNEQGRILLDEDGLYHEIASVMSEDIFVPELLSNTVKQYDSNGNLRYTHGRFQWRHYRAFLRNLFT